MQEVSDMSGGITRKMSSAHHGSLPMLDKVDNSSTVDVSDTSTVGTEDSVIHLYDRTHTMFPPTKRMLKSPRKTQLESAISLPQLNIEHGRGVNKHTLELPLNKTNIVKDSAALQINGRIQFDHYMNDKQNILCPLVLPNVKAVRLTHGKDRIDSYVYTKKVSLYPKGKFGSRSQWDLWSRHSERNQVGAPARWRSHAQITIPSTSQSARD